MILEALYIGVMLGIMFAMSTLLHSPTDTQLDLMYNGAVSIVLGLAWPIVIFVVFVGESGRFLSSRVFD